ncbi:MAG: hypothetical protein JST75_15315 [Bacteroidetes bacterium]|nr:hypothetical protein [Bacteroidota bacterium]
MDKAQLSTQVINYANIGEAIDHEFGAKIIKNYQDANPDQLAQCFTIGRDIIEQILAQPGCVALRIYNALNENGEHTLVYAGVDKQGDTIFEYPAISEAGKLGQVQALVGDMVLGGFRW